MTSEHASDLTGIAVVGMALRVPGARTPGEYWNNLLAGVESIRALTDEELIAAGESPDRLRHPRYVKAAAVLPDMECFDPEFFGLSPKEAGIMDPQHRHLLECAWEALEDSGHVPEHFDGAIGVWAGCGMGAYFARNILSNQDLIDSTGLFLLRHTGNDKDFLATRISYALNLRGPSVGVQTACSTSLVAIHYACQSLLAGECDMALAGGVTIEIPHARGYVFEEGEILAPDGHCRAFDQRAAGTVFGSGAGIVVLRRLQDAIADGDRIYAVIKGSAVNNDGAGKVGYLAPSVDGQAAAVAEALAVAGIGADSIGYVECHGTGTAVGDPIEVAALATAFRETTDERGYCAIGSVKTNIGHLDTAAGVASLIKAALCVQHGTIPPSLNFEKPNPLIDFAATPFFVNAALRDFPVRGDGAPRRASVNSLGVGGTNAHVVLEQAPPSANEGLYDLPPSTELLVLSARRRDALDRASRRLAEHLRAHPQLRLADVAYTLHTARKHFAERRVLACRDREHAIALLEAHDARNVFTHTAAPATSVVFMFPGGGTQYPGMGQRLYATEPAFREQIDRGLERLAARVTHDPRALLFPAPEMCAQAAEALQRPSLQLPLIYIVEYALAQLCMSRGIEPAALIGHSVGENTAAAVAGVISFEDGLDLVLLRGQLFDEVPEGGMISVPLSADELAPLLGADLDLACVNAPGLSVASGPKASLERLERELAERDVQVHWVRIQIAAHSRMIEPILGRFRDFVQGIELKAPRIPILSNRSGDVLTDAQARSPEYWVEHLRNTVRFGDGIAKLVEQSGRVFLEVGPGRALCSLARQHPKLLADPAVIASLPHPDDDTPDDEMFLAACGRLWAAGVAFDLARARSGGKRARAPLPTYPFDRQRYWIEPQAARPSTSSAQPSRIDDLERSFFAPVWRQHFPDLEPDDAVHTWLVFVDETGFGAALVDKLRAGGDQVICVLAGDTFAKASDDEYYLAPEQGADGYGLLLREVLASGKTPDRVLHLWLLSDGEQFRPGSSFFHRNQERGFFSLLFFAQALAAVDLPSSLHIAVVSSGMQQAGAAPMPYPEQATVLGPCKVIPRELPGVTCLSIDLVRPAETPDPPAFGNLLAAADRWLPAALARPDATKAAASAVDRAGLLDALCTELRLPPSNGEIMIGPGARWERRYERMTAPAAVHTRLRARGVYMITGGLGGIGLAIARSLAQSERARLVLVQRAPLPAREIWDEWLERRPNDPASARIRSIRQLEALGAEVLACAGDVADIDRMTQIVAEAKAHFGALHGVVHAAGLLDDAPIAAKRQQSVEAVFGPKVYGTLVLDRVLAAEPLDFLVLFSSTSTAIAAAGQVDYVAANAFLDAYAERACAQGRSVLSLAWGVWNEVGLAATAGARIRSAALREGAASTAAYPLFRSRATLQGGGIMLHGTLSADTAWILDEHRTKNARALLPGTGYVELARAALRELGEDGPFCIEDLYFLRPLEVRDGARTDFRVRLSPCSDGFTFEVHSKAQLASGSEGYVLHAQALVRRMSAPAPAPLDRAAIRARCSVRKLAPAVEGHRVAQEKHLRFGPRWRNLRSCAFGDGEAFGELQLPEPYPSELATFGLHPALLDIATGFAIELEPSYGAGDRLWVPVSYERVSVYSDLKARIGSHVRLRSPSRAHSGFARFDVSICDEAGCVLMEIEGFSMQAIAADSFEPAELRLADLEHDGPQRELSSAERAFLNNLSNGLTPSQGVAAFRRLVDTLPRARVIVSSLELRELIRQADASAPPAAQTAAASFERPALRSEYIAPRNDVERALAALWQDLLGVTRVGVRDDFFELGGHSLVAVRLFARMKKAFGVDHPISTLIEHPTIEGCARIIMANADQARCAAVSISSAEPRARSGSMKHLVPMNPPSADKQGRLPFFLVGGMFGNVLNLRHLAGLIGEDRPFYGVQARGLIGSEDPHETFEAMAHDYLAEISAVQPRGPYLIGGFSGGGIAAYEMARQLIAAGEDVPLLVLLDTPLPHDDPLTLGERLAIHKQNFERTGPRHALDWARVKLSTLRASRGEAHAAPAHDPANFRSRLIEAAFYRAQLRYDIRPAPVEILLCRPRLQPAHVFASGHAINRDRRRIYHDNGWTPFARRVEVFETPGDHDSMILEPNVRILAAHLRPALELAERSAKQRPRQELPDATAERYAS